MSREVKTDENSQNYVGKGSTFRWLKPKAQLSPMRTVCRYGESHQSFSPSPAGAWVAAGLVEDESFLKKD